MDAKYKEIFKAAAERPGMYLIEESLNCYVSFVSGYDMAHSGNPLSGFGEWLVKKEYIGSNQVWCASVYKINDGSEEEKILSFYKIMSEYFESKTAVSLEN